MLYERWRETVRRHGSSLALEDAATASRWTFHQLDRAAESTPAAFPGAIDLPEGYGPEFILRILRAWRHGFAVCPVEPGQIVRPLPQPPRDIVLLKSTSATTGAPRWIAFTAEQLAADADQIVATMGLRPDWPNLGVISLAHSYGFASLVLPLILHGIPLVLAGSPLPESMKRVGATRPEWTLPAVPALWRAWWDAHAIPEGVRLAISAGAPLPWALERAILDGRQLKVHNFLGASECGGIAYDTRTDLRPDPALAGRPMVGVILDRTETGCLRVRSRAVGQGYWPDHDPSLGSGQFTTSDLVTWDGNELRLLGRASDQINMAGRKLSPIPIEEALLGHPAVTDALVLGLPDADEARGELIAAIVVARQPVDATILSAYLRDQLPAWQVPREWHFRDSLALNARGKASRARWRSQLRPHP